MRCLGRSRDDDVWAAAKFAVFARQCLLSPQIARGFLFMYFDRAHLSEDVDRSRLSIITSSDDTKETQGLNELPRSYGRDATRSSNVSSVTSVNLVDPKAMPHIVGRKADTAPNTDPCLDILVGRHCLAPAMPLISSTASIPPRSLGVSDVFIYVPPRFSNAASHSRASF